MYFFSFHDHNFVFIFYSMMIESLENFHLVKNFLFFFLNFFLLCLILLEDYCPKNNEIYFLQNINLFQIFNLYLIIPCNIDSKKYFSLIKLFESINFLILFLNCYFLERSYLFRFFIIPHSFILNYLFYFIKITFRM